MSTEAVTLKQCPQGQVPLACMSLYLIFTSAKLGELMTAHYKSYGTNTATHSSKTPIVLQSRRISRMVSMVSHFSVSIVIPDLGDF